MIPTAPVGPSSVSPPAQQPSTVTAEAAEAAAVVRQRSDVARAFRNEATASSALMHANKAAKLSRDQLERNKTALDSISAQRELAAADLARVQDILQQRAALKLQIATQQDKVKAALHVLTTRSQTLEQARSELQHAQDAETSTGHCVYKLTVHLEALRVASAHSNALHVTCASHVAQLQGLFAAEPCGAFNIALQAYNERVPPEVDTETQQHLDDLHSGARTLKMPRQSLNARPSLEGEML